MKEKNKISSDERKILIFKYMVQFLEIFGYENYGESAEVDWGKTFNYCTSCGLFDFNPEVESLVFENTDEEFRDNVFEFVEKQVLEGYPVWRLFKMSKWLEDKCEEELKIQEHLKDIKYYNTTRCYRCKYFKNSLEIGFAHALSPLDINHFKNMDECNEEMTRLATKTVSGKPIIKFVKHNMTCGKRLEMIDERKKNDEANGKHTHSFSRFEHNYENGFKYKKFNYNDDSQPEYPNSWVLNPMVLKRCPFFEENPDMTPEKFEKLYGEIPRYEIGD